MRKLLFLILTLCFITPTFAATQSEKLERITGVTVSSPMLEVKQNQDDKEFCTKYLNKAHYWDESQNKCLPLDPSLHTRPEPNSLFFRGIGPEGTFSGIMY